MSTTVLWYIFEDSLMRQQAQTLLYPVPRPVPRPQQLVDRPEPAPEEALTESPKPERVESLCSHPTEKTETVSGQEFQRPVAGAGAPAREMRKENDTLEK